MYMCALISLLNGNIFIRLQSRFAIVVNIETAPEAQYILPFSKHLTKSQLEYL